MDDEHDRRHTSELEVRMAIAAPSSPCARARAASVRSDVLVLKGAYCKGLSIRGGHKVTHYKIIKLLKRVCRIDLVEQAGCELR